MSINQGIDNKSEEEVTEMIKEKKNIGFVGIYNIMEQEKMKTYYFA